MARANLTWSPRTIVVLAAVVIFILAGIGVDIGEEQDLVAWGLAVFAASFLI